MFLCSKSRRVFLHVAFCLVHQDSVLFLLVLFIVLLLVVDHLLLFCRVALILAESTTSVRDKSARPECHLQGRLEGISQQSMAKIENMFSVFFRESPPGSLRSVSREDIELCLRPNLQNKKRQIKKIIKMLRSKDAKLKGCKDAKIQKWKNAKVQRCKDEKLLTSRRLKGHQSLPAVMQWRVWQEQWLTIQNGGMWQKKFRNIIFSRVLSYYSFSLS